MLALVLFCFVGSALGSHLIVQNELIGEPESAEAAYLGLSAGATRTVGNIRLGFSCQGKSYGYYADVANNCQLFHICHPSQNAKGEPVVYQYSHFCPAGTRFDQSQLSCVGLESENLLSCGESIRFFPATERLFAEVPVIQRDISYLSAPLVQQRREPILFEEQRREVLPVARAPLVNNFATKSFIRSESLPVAPVAVAPVAQTYIERPSTRILETQNVLTQPIAPIVQRSSFVESAPIVRNTIPTLSQPLVSSIREVTRPVLSVPQSQIPIPSYFEQRALLRNQPITQLREPY